MNLTRFRATHRGPAPINDPEFLAVEEEYGCDAADALNSATACEATAVHLYRAKRRGQTWTTFILEGPLGFQWMECGKGGPVREPTLAEAETALWEELLA